jgi:hypothetical protein
MLVRLLLLQGFDMFSLILTKQFCREAATMVGDAVDAGVMSR